jgi:hypothetical protein
VDVGVIAEGTAADVGYILGSVMGIQPGAAHEAALPAVGPHVNAAVEKEDAGLIGGVSAGRSLQHPGWSGQDSHSSPPAGIGRGRVGDVPGFRRSGSTGDRYSARLREAISGRNKTDVIDAEMLAASEAVLGVVPAALPSSGQIGLRRALRRRHQATVNAHRCESRLWALSAWLSSDVWKACGGHRLAQPLLARWPQRVVAAPDATTVRVERPAARAPPLTGQL